MAAVHLPTFGLLLKRHRQAAGMTQEELAERARMSARGIGDLERGVRHPRRDTLRLLLDALQLTPDEQSRLESAARMRSAPAMDAGPVLEPGNFLGALPPSPLVGRRREISRVLAALDIVVEGSGRLMLLTGEPGIGKTRIAQESALEARKRGFLVATGRCYEQEQDVPYSPLVEALTGAYPALPRSIREDIPERWPYISALLPDDIVQIPTAARSGRAGGMEGQQRLFRAVSGLLNAVAAEMPVAVLFDDLHWVDDASLTLLAHLARHTRGGRVLVLGTYRDVEVDARHPLERVLVDLNRERLVERVVLHHLGPEDTSTLITEILGREVVDLQGLTAMVYDVTNGNPFFIHEILRTLVDRGDLCQEEGRWHRRDIQEIPPPSTVRAAIQQRLAQLPPATEAVLREASVLGQTFGFDELQVLGRRQEEEVDEALDSAARMGLVREAGQDQYAFNHVLTQQTLYADLSQRRRQRLHLRAGEVLARIPEPVRVRRAGEIAWHFREGGNAQQAVAHSMVAGDRAETLFAYGEAERHFRHAVELTSTSRWDAGIDPLLRPRALARLGRVLHIVERYDEALDTIEQAADLYRAHGDLLSEVMSVAEIGWIHHSRQTDGRGVERILPLLSRVQEEEARLERDRMLAILHTALARLYFGLERCDDELDAAECAANAARRAKDDEVLAVAEARRGAALMTLGRRDEAQEALEQAIQLAETTGNLGTMSVALDNLGDIACDHGEYRRSRREFERAVEVAEQTGLPSRMGWTRVKLGRILLLMGEWPQARAIFERSSQLLEDDDRSAAYPGMYLAQLRAWTGDSPRSVDELEAATVMAARRQDRWLLRQGNLVLASLDLLAGRPDAARNRLAPLFEERGRDEPHVVLAYSSLAWACLILDREDDVEQTLARGLEQARLHSHDVARSDLLRIEGMLRTHQKRWEEARRALDQVIHMVERMPDPYRLAHVLAERSVLSILVGDERGARQQRERALAIAQRLEARPFMAYIERRTLS